MLSGLKNLGDMAKFVKQAQEAKQRMKSLETELQQMVISAESSDGLVTVTCNGKGAINGVIISKELLETVDKVTIEESILGALQKVQTQAHYVGREKLAMIAEQYGLPKETVLPD